MAAIIVMTKMLLFIYFAIACTQECKKFGLSESCILLVMNVGGANQYNFLGLPETEIILKASYTTGK